MSRKLKPARKFGGTITVPGDKSIAHRAALLSLLAEEPITAHNYPDGADCQTSLTVAEQFGVKVERRGDAVILTPPKQIQIDAETMIDCGNSGTTARLLAGIIAGSDLEVILSGDESLSRRPMKRIVDPLCEMGAELFADDGHLPLKVRGKKLLPFEYRMPVASAQVKSSILLAGLASGCTVTVREDVVTRDHTELMVQAIGDGLHVRDIKPVMQEDPHDPRRKRMVMPEDFKREISLKPDAHVYGGLIEIPGDISTAAFFFAVAAMSGSSVTVQNVGLNPTRTGFLDYLKSIGCDVVYWDKTIVSGEQRGTVTVTGRDLKDKKISGETTVSVIDEVPIIAVIAAKAQGTTVIRDAAELRVKESDRLQAISDNLSAMGVKCGLLEDGIAVEGGKEMQGADLKSFGDHRIAMAFSVAALFADGPSTLDDDECVSISCPQFYDLLSKVAQ